MKNIEYLTKFFKKHNLSGSIKVSYTSPKPDDDSMSTITFPNGTVITIQDVIFDIISELPEDVVNQWLKSKITSEVSLSDWVESDNHYTPQIDTSSMDEYKREMEAIVEEVKENISKLFELEIDDEDEEDSDYEYDGSDYIEGEDE